MTNIYQLAQLAQHSYETKPGVSQDSGYTEQNMVVENDFWSGGTGLTAHSYFSAADNTLVIAYAGTSKEDFSSSALDWYTDAQLAITGGSNQDSGALQFAQNEIAAAKLGYGSDIKVVITGHSLGGYLAQTVGLSLGDAVDDIAVFNCPGVGGLLGTDAVDDRVDYYFSDPETWEGLTPRIHSTGEPLSDNIFFIMNADGHGIESIVNALDGIPPLPNVWSRDQMVNHIAEEFREVVAGLGELEAAKAAKQIYDKYDGVYNSIILEAVKQSHDSCFPAGTLIAMADGSSKPIEAITTSDWVLSFNEQGDLVPAPVTQLLDNVTTEWLKLSNGTVVTPGHRYLRPDGSFMEIKEIIAGDGRIVTEAGQVITVTAEAIHYSADTAHMFEQHEKLVSATSGATALAPEVKTGWRTYNFTVGGTHTYIADGVQKAA